MSEEARRISDLLLRCLEGRVDPHEFDDFISCRHPDARLDAIRRLVARVPDDHPPASSGAYASDEGLDVLRRIAQELRAPRRGDGGS